VTSSTQDSKLKTQNSAIDYADGGSILNPLKSLSFFGRKPVTEPLEPRLAALRYRGFHLNDWEKCVGCSTCQKVCDNSAITMVKVPGLPEDPAKGIRNLRPAIDYGRCCWCALCVDLCPTGSIRLSREYVHTCTDDNLDSYFMLPDPKGMHDKYYGEGWVKTEENDLIDPSRRPMQETAPEQRIGNFDEIVAGFEPNEAIMEASRCVQCGMCHDACPTHMNAPEYIRAIWENDLEEAVRQIYRTNPFAHTCGRVCTHRCETACSIGNRGEPIAIRWLKRYAMDAVDHERVKQIAAEDKVDYFTGKRVAIVGGGPAGLTAAYDLAKKGHEVTVFEALDKAGGMPRYGIPYYRMPADMLDRDLDVITSLGVKIQYNTRIGEDLSMQQLEQDFDAVVLAIGLQLGRSTRIPGSEHPGVEKAVALLRRIAAGETLDAPDSVTVIGGGNVAMDIARSMARLQKQQLGQVRVTVTALEDKAHFLADPEEIKESLEEGVEIFDARGPREVVIEAIGQLADVELLGEDLTERLEWNRGRLKVDAHCRTSEPWLWAAGDMVLGPDVVSAVRDGHAVAASVDAFLNVREQAA